jgi:hypothetical protein
MENEKRNKTYFPKWFYVLAIALLGLWAILVLFFAIGTLVHFLLFFAIIIIVILILKGPRNQAKS